MTDLTPEACKNLDSILEHRAAKIRSLERDVASLQDTVLMLSHALAAERDFRHQLQAKLTALLERARFAERWQLRWKALARRQRVTTPDLHGRAQPEECNEQHTS